MAYKIQPGDTLTKIALENNTTVDALLMGNPHITDKNKIFAGQTLNVPSAEVTPAGPPKTSNECVADCPLSKQAAPLPAATDKINLLEAGDDEILDALKKNCSGITDINHTLPGDIKNTRKPSRAVAEGKIDTCLAKYELTSEDQEKARAILTHWSRNELYEMPVYQGTLADFKKDFEAAGYRVEKYPDYASVYHTNKNPNATKWKVFKLPDKEGDPETLEGWEYVFTGNEPDSTIVTDIEDAGTYNIKPVEGHTGADVVPYYYYGSGPTDSTTVFQRTTTKNVQAASGAAKEKAGQAAQATKKAVQENVVEPLDKASKAISDWFK